MNHPPIDTTQEIRAVLGEWRTHTLNVILSIAAAAMTVAVTVLLIDTVLKPEQLAAMLIFLACDLVLIGLAVLRRIDVRLRGLGFLLLGYCGGILALSRGGLAGAGREYLIMLPIIGIILVGVRVGLLLTGLSAAIMGIFALLARLGAFQDWLAQGWLIYAQNPLNLEAERRAKVELNQAHQLLGDYSQSLEQKVEQRTVELVRASDEAIEARSSAEAASRAKSEFLANMSHEIRTPMNAILGMTTFLQDTALTPQQQDFVETIRSSENVLLAIINDILDISKIEAGRMELALHPFDVRECIESAIDLVAPKAAEKDLELICTVAETVPTHIFSDPTRLRQILINLLSNAVKFTNAGEVEITAACEKITSLRPATGTLGTYLLNFAVRDTGIGISSAWTACSRPSARWTPR